MDISNKTGCFLGFPLLDEMDELLVLFDRLLLPFLYKSLLARKVVESFLEVIHDPHHVVVLAEIKKSVVKLEVFPVIEIEIILLDGVFHIAVKHTQFIYAFLLH